MTSVPGIITEVSVLLLAVVLGSIGIGALARNGKINCDENIYSSDKIGFKNLCVKFYDNVHNFFSSISGKEFANSLVESAEDKNKFLDNFYNKIAYRRKEDIKSVDVQSTRDYLKTENLSDKQKSLLNKFDEKYKDFLQIVTQEPQKSQSINQESNLKKNIHIDGIDSVDENNGELKKLKFKKSRKAWKNVTIGTVNLNNLKGVEYIELEKGEPCKISFRKNTTLKNVKIGTVNLNNLKDVKYIELEKDNNLLNIYCREDSNLKDITIGGVYCDEMKNVRLFKYKIDDSGIEIENYDSTGMRIEYY